MSSIGQKITSLLPTLEQIAEVALNVAKVLPVGGNVISAIQLGVQIANGIANEVPVIVQTYDDIKAAIAGGQPITDDQWAAWQTQVDSAHAEFLADIAKVENQPG